MQHVWFSLFSVHVHYITVGHCEVGIFKAFQLFITYIIFYFIRFAMKIACEFKHTL